MANNEMLQSELQALQIVVHGVVQGVGFRPFVYRLAHEHHLSGTIVNNGEGVCIEVTGTPDKLHLFISELQHKAPPVARITSLEVREDAAPADGAGFTILASEAKGRANTQIAPDIAVCSDCLAELNDPADRRYRYPFINCTNCGPRFTIVEKIPYDRPNTSMKVFPLCTQCRQEYEDPLNRRFHAQPNACPDCGPALSWHDRDGNTIESGDCLDAAVQALRSGAVVAVKGLGGFHLAVNALSAEAVSRLRQRKHRKEKPLAVMVCDLAAVEQVCRISALERQLLLSPEHPIVLLPEKRSSPLARNVAPGIGEIGVMLPYTPLHHLMLDHPLAPAALVMTSGNLSHEPICTGNDEALERLSGIADYFLLHNREIVTRVDDSVVRVMSGKPRLLRRGRGYAPVPLQLGQPSEDILACGAEMKNSFCLVRDNEAFISQHIGELTGPESMDFYTESIEHLQKVLERVPATVACDMHPDYLSTRYAQGLGKNTVAVQHHHAHAAAVMAEHGLADPVLAMILDGTGYGEDGTVCGGELYLADRSSYTRLGHLRHLPLPGGDRAAREPWRMGISLLYASLGSSGLDESTLPPGLQRVEKAQRNLLVQMMEKNVNSPLTSSCGRLFDGVAALLGNRLEVDFEAQAAMELEHQAMTARRRPAGPEQGRYQPTLIRRQTLRVVDYQPLVEWILEDLHNMVDVNVIALSFHDWLIRSISLLVTEAGHEQGIDTVVLGGGCFQNKLLFEGVEKSLLHENLTVYSGELVPVNDGGIALGQAYAGGL